jgi:hypothetical protein
VYDYLLGGKDNYAVDREAAEKILALAPSSRRLARSQRAFLVRSVRYMAETGIRQFIDLGTGIPTSPNVHEVARSVHPSARIVYVDFDPVVIVHNTALLSTNDGVVSVGEDIRNPDAILGHPDVVDLIDFNEPIGVLLLAVLHNISDAEGPGEIIGRFRDRMAPGSHIAISHFSLDSAPHALKELEATYAGTPWPKTIRSREEILRFFDGFELVPPGLVDMGDWRPDLEEPPTELKIPGGVGRKV